MLHGKNIVHMTQGSNELHFFYDASNKPAIVEFNGSKYAYVHNLQGDIVAILDSNGAAVVQYKYDAWGKPISKTGSMKDSLGTLNPFRYREYVYDEETGLYYLRSRFYSPKACRFVNSDSILGKKGLISHNIYAYCKSAPIMKSDADGFEPDSSFPLFAFLYLSAFLPDVENLDKNRPTDFSAFEDHFTAEFIDSIELNTELTKIIKSMPDGQTSTSTSLTMYWTPKWAAYPFSSDGDLAFALGTIKINITVEKVSKGPLEWMHGFGDKYRVKYSFSDFYDFTEFDISLDNILMIIPNAINNYLGYVPQEAGILHKYYYSVSGEYYIYVADLFGVSYVNGGYQ